MVKELNNETFKEALESKETVLVDFYADWCGPCKMLGPIMEEIANEITVYKVNVDEAGDLARDLGIMSIPCVIAFKDGQEINRSIGLKSKSEIMEMVK